MESGKGSITKPASYLSQISNGRKLGLKPYFVAEFAQLTPVKLLSSDNDSLATG